MDKNDKAFLEKMEESFLRKSAMEADFPEGPDKGYIAGIRQEKKSGSIPESSVIDKEENFAGAIVGALLGSLIGVILIVLLVQIGYASAIGGAVTGVCTFKGYAKKGGSLSGKGMVISIIIMIVMVWLANRIGWSVSLWRDVFTEETPFSVFRYFNDAVDQLNGEGMDVSVNYYGSLLIEYMFSALGAGGVVISMSERRKRH